MAFVSTLIIVCPIYLQEIPISPFCIKVEPSHDAGKVKAEGPGLSRTGEAKQID